MKRTLRRESNENVKSMRRNGKEHKTWFGQGTPPWFERNLHYACRGMKNGFISCASWIKGAAAVYLAWKCQMLRDQWLTRRYLEWSFPENCRGEDKNPSEACGRPPRGGVGALSWRPSLPSWNTGQGGYQCSEFYGGENHESGMKVICKDAGGVRGARCI